MFDLDRFVDDCRAARAANRSPRLVREMVARAVSDPADLLRALGEPRRAQLQKLYHAPDLTILNLVWAPMMTAPPHDHRMWAVIGLYTGREDNVFWRRIGGAPDGRIEAVGARALAAGEACALERGVVHSVTNPISRLTGAIHVYGGDFFAAHRSEWDPESLREGRFDPDQAVRRFEEANR